MAKVKDKYPFGPQAGKPCTPEEAADFYVKARAGCQHSRNALIAGHSYLLPLLVGGYIGRNADASHLYDDLYGEAQYRLCTIIDTLIARQHMPDEIGCVLNLDLSQEICHSAMELRESLAVSHDTLSRLAKNDKELPTARALSDRDHKRHSPDTTDTCRLSGLVDACCTTEREATIVAKRLEGYTDGEIAKQLGVSTTTVRNDRVAIGNRLNKLLPTECDFTTAA